MTTQIRQTAVKDAIANLGNRQNISAFSIRRGQAIAQTVLQNKGSASRAVRLGMQASKNTHRVNCEV